MTAIILGVAVSLLLLFIYLAWDTRRRAVYNYQQGRVHRDALVRQLQGAQARIQALEQQLQAGKASAGVPQAKVPPSEPKYSAHVKASPPTRATSSPAQHVTYASDPVIVPVVHSHYDYGHGYGGGHDSGGCGDGGSGGGGGGDGGGSCGGCGGCGGA